MKVRIKFKKYGALRFISHLDVMRYFQKAMRRAQIPIAFTGGYSPHMIMSFASPLGIGISSEGEYFDIELKNPISSKKAVEQLNKEMAEGIEVISFRQISDEKKMTGMALVAAADYKIMPAKCPFPENYKEKTEEFISLPEIPAVKTTKRSEKETDIKPLIYQIKPDEDGIFIRAAAGSAANLKPELVADAFCKFLGIPYEDMGFKFRRIEIYANINKDDPEDFVSLEELGAEIP